MHNMCKHDEHVHEWWVCDCACVWTWLWQCETWWVYDFLWVCLFGNTTSNLVLSNSHFFQNIAQSVDFIFQSGILIFINDRLLFKIGGNYPPEGSKDVLCGQVHQSSRPILLYVSRRIIHDNGPQFVSQAFQIFCNKFRIQNVSSATYYPTANDLAEAFNKTINKLLKKFVSKSQRDWDEKLGECLWAYRTTVRTPTKAMPFSLVYGCEAVLPLEIQILSLCIALANRDDKWGQASIMPPNSTTDRVLPSSNHKSLQQESHGTHFQERRSYLSCQTTRDHDTQDQKQISV